MRSIDFDDEQDTVKRALTITDAQVWKVSSEAGSNVVTENLLDYVALVVAEPAPKTDPEYRVSVNRANMRNGPSTRNGVIAKLERGTAVRLLPSIRIMGEVACCGHKSRWLDFQKTVEKS